MSRTHLASEAPGPKSGGPAASDERTSGLRLRDEGPYKRTRRCVLLAEDEEDTREMYAWCLRAAGWVVAHAADGHEALRVAFAVRPDVILMDIGLPGMDGLQATLRLKVDERTKHIPVVALTGHGRSSAEFLATNVGCERFVAKPCPPEDLRVVLEELIAGR